MTIQRALADLTDEYLAFGMATVALHRRDDLTPADIDHLDVALCNLHDAVDTALREVATRQRKGGKAK